jgi:hypothetical protein
MESTELLALRKHVPDLIEAAGPYGSIIVAPGLQGRIFCTIDGRMAHRLDAALLAKPHAEEFNNFGGNSLWPAPEGGPFAFNYPQGGGWRVQEGVNKTNMRVVEKRGLTPSSPFEMNMGPRFSVVLEKTVELANRRGARLKLAFRRDVLLNPDPAASKIGKSSSIQYCTTDTLAPLGEYSPDQALFAPWSLEQFPLSEDVIVFARAGDPRAAMNFDYYGPPAVQPVYGPQGLAMRLGGADKFQFGLRARNWPTMIGALDRKRELLVLRAAMPTKGFQDVVSEKRGQGEKGTGSAAVGGACPLLPRYFNIADNDQPAGPWSAADMYSIFYGAKLGFYELETIAPAWIAGNRLAESVLTTMTSIYHGDLPAMEDHVAALLGVPTSALSGM